MKKLINKYLPRIIGLQLNSIYRINKKKAVIKVYRIFCTPRRGKIKPHHENFLKNAQASSIKIGSIDIQIYHWKKENAPTLLLVHGWDSNSGRWEMFVKHFQKDYNIVAFDSPAQGNSGGKVLHVPIYAKTLNKMMKLYQPDYLIGHSMGGMTIFFHEYQNNSSSVKKIVSLGAPSELSNIMADLKRVMRLKTALMKDVEMYFKEKFGYKFSEFSSQTFVRRIQAPTLLIHDQYDKVVGIEEAKMIHEALPTSELIITEGAGHSLAKTKVNQAIEAFLKD
ncbi:MAG: alpha/beta hydrolase [Flavobacteriaceae bacterium]|nr:alpha/beta hydrolase [Flavobacteriaceae bacterium]